VDWGTRAATEPGVCDIKVAVGHFLFSLVWGICGSLAGSALALTEEAVEIRGGKPN
jgi:hypothetical protein